MAQIDIRYNGRDYTIPFSDENREELRSLGELLSEGRSEVLNLDAAGHFIQFAVGPGIPIAVSYVD